ncbi:MAG: T9SS type A sorting domain-containing protein [Bacteroidetes bacterium]|nr:T9SS type A sorting domain-containing protein [Bacteroidota bacterium]
MKKIYFVIITLVILLSNNSFSQCSLYPVSLASKINNSALIVEGKVISQRSFWNAERNYIRTSNVINVTQVIKGSINFSFIEIITEGGEVDMNKQVVDPSLQLVINDEGIFTLNSFDQPSQFGHPVFQVYADQQGFYKFNVKENIAVVPFKNYNDINTVYKEFEILLGIDLPDYVNLNANKFSSSSSVAAITGISPLVITAGTASVLTITGSGFGATQGSSIVEFKNADDGGATFIQPHSSQYVSWSNTQIQVQVPTRSSSTLTGNGTAGTGQVQVTVGASTLSAQTLTVSYGELNALVTNTLTAQQVFNTRHIDLNTMNGITWQMFTSFNANSAAKTAFLSAFQTWRCNTNINWLLGTAVTTNTIAFDGVNVVRFDIGTELPVGVLGRCTTYFGVCSFGPNIFVYVSELDICFDDPATSAITWNFGPALATGGQYDFESVAVHELGHGHQLSHVINNSDVMHFSIGGGVNKRTLIAADINAGNDVMTRNVSAPICGKGNLVAITASLCSVSAPTSTFNLISPVCIAQTVSLTSNSTGGPTNFSWTATGGSTSTSTLQNTTTSYASPGIYSVTLLVTNGIGTSSITKTISVLAIPSVVVTSSNICSGGSANMSATGATSFTWNPGGLTGANQTLSPATTQVYTIIGSNGTCTNSSTGSVNVTTTPTVAVSNASTCAGTPVSVTASGVTNYTFNPGTLVGATQNLNPATTTTYTVTGANGSCANAKSFTLTVIANPTVGAGASNSVICNGFSVTLTGNGATTYTFNPGAIIGNPVTVNPASNTTYTVIGKTNGCSGTNTVAVSVSSCTGINKISALEGLKVFPNPTQGFVTLNFGETFSGQLTLFNSLGQLLTDQKINDVEKAELNLNTYPKGVYLIKLVPANGKARSIRIIRD